VGVNCCPFGFVWGSNWVCFGFELGLFFKPLQSKNWLCLAEMLVFERGYPRILNREGREERKGKEGSA